jgi:hypothetical protein
MAYPSTQPVAITASFTLASFTRGNVRQPERSRGPHGHAAGVGR